MFKLRLSLLEAINRVAKTFGENQRVERALWWLLDLIHATKLEKQVVGEIIMSKWKIDDAKEDK